MKRAPKIDACGRVCSLGRERLNRAIDQGMTHEGIARACGVSRATIGRLAAGVRTDSYDLRLALEQLLAIPMHAWDEPAEERSEMSARAE